MNKNLLEKAKIIVNSSDILGYTGNILKNAANNDEKSFIEYLKNIAEQAWDKKSSETTIKIYSKELVDITKLLFPLNQKKFIKEALYNILLNENQNNLTLYHGSRFKFDSFDLSKINTGQASQDFGWGLYFTSKKDVGEFYANMLSNKKTISEKYKEFFIDMDINDDILKQYINDNNIIGAKRRINALIQSNKYDKNKLTEFLKYIDTVNRFGYIYTVTVQNPNMLDFNGNVPDNIIQKINEKFKLNTQNLKTSTLYTILTKINGNEKNASQYLKSMGVDGIRYPVNSRKLNKQLTDTNEENFVIFNADIIQITNIEKIEFKDYLKI